MSTPPSPKDDTAAEALQAALERLRDRGIEVRKQALRELTQLAQFVAGSACEITASICQ